MDKAVGTTELLGEVLLQFLEKRLGCGNSTSCFKTGGHRLFILNMHRGGCFARGWAEKAVCQRVRGKCGTVTQESSMARKRSRFDLPGLYDVRFGPVERALGVSCGRWSEHVPWIVYDPGSFAICAVHGKGMCQGRCSSLGNRCATEDVR